MTNQNKTLMIAVDPIKTEHSLKNALSSVKTIAEKAGWNSKIVTVMSPDQINWPNDFTSDWLTVFQKVGAAAIGKLLKKSRLNPTTVKFEVLFQPYNSRKGSIKKVITETESTKAAAVAVFTHIRTGGLKLPAGFVSTMVSEAERPILVINAKGPAIKKLDYLVFATDFSENDAKSFEQALKFANQVKAKILIVHVLPNLVNEVMAAYAGIAGGWNNYGPFLELQYEKAEADGKAWKAKAKSCGVEAEFEMLSNARTIPGAVIRSAKKHRADLIMLTEKTGPWASALLGSVTRKILETSTLPVLVFPVQQARQNMVSEKVSS